VAGFFEGIPKEIDDAVEVASLIGDPLRGASCAADPASPHRHECPLN
jgi:hypothetical protein